MKTNPFVLNMGFMVFPCLPQEKFVPEYKFEPIFPWDPSLPGPLSFNDLSKEEFFMYMAIDSPALPVFWWIRNETFNSRHGNNLDRAGIYFKTELSLC